MKCAKRTWGRTNLDPSASVPPFPQEALLIDAIPEMSADRVLCTSPGLGQFAEAAATAMPHAVVACTYLDQYRASLALNHWLDPLPNLRIGCAADLPEEEADVVAFPFAAAGDAELTRDLIQTGHERLRIGGKMYASTDNSNDSWMREQLSKVFNKLDRRAFPTGALYVGTKTEPLKKIKNFACEFAFRDQGRLIRAFSRPGVFSHRHIDTGARRLIDEMQIAPGARVLDIGCGAGVVALAAAFRGDGVTVHAVDSHARAVQCTQQGTQLNQLTNVTTELKATGGYIGRGTYDLALANPPYYASFRIAEHFLTAGLDALRPGGRIVVVTKRPDWYQERMPELYDRVTVKEVKSYHLVQGIRPSDGI